MANIEAIPNYILKDAARNLGWRWDDKTEPIESYLEQMRAMSIKKIFGLYCNWQGLIDWGSNLFEIVEELQRSEKG